MTPSSEIVFQPNGRRGRFKHGTTVLDVAKELGVDSNSRAQMVGDDPG